MTHYITVSRCNGPRGLLVGINHDHTEMWPYAPNDGPHDQADMEDKLGVFSLVLDPKSEEISDLSEYTRCQPLAEYQGRFGIAFKAGAK